MHVWISAYAGSLIKNAADAAAAEQAPCDDNIILRAVKSASSAGATSEKIRHGAQGVNNDESSGGSRDRGMYTVKGKEERGSNLCCRRPRVTASAPFHLRLPAPRPLALPAISGGGRPVYDTAISRSACWLL